MPYLQKDEELQKARNKRFVRRVFFLRQLGTLLCFCSFLFVLQSMSYGSWIWYLLGVNTFIWPTLAYILSQFAKDPIKIEQHNLVADTFLGGIWIALMGANPWPSLILISVFIADRYAAGGWKLLRISMLAFIISFSIVWVILGCPINAQVTPYIMWSTLPLATVYMIALSVVSRHLSIQMSAKYRKIEKMAMMDPHLHIPNRRLFEQRLVSTFLQVQRSRYRAYLMLLDVDHFKEVNDTYGHETGDYVLAEISNILKAVIRPKDIPARYGGDELALIVFDYEDQQVLALANEICHRVAQLKLPNDQKFQTSMSIGIAPAKASSSTIHWLEQADKALYNVKRQGRNGVKLSQFS
ncbi:diguanylate cyclase [Acinetobacter sp. MD2]|uniref:diguanylate cyclase n=1 Tax=Acinetobacter sp. MD2 TaxID=2600066 RepID=UPI002D1E84EC|nr:diguanylate cyclase [Acinetobacter sp. MD2]MEB3767848.1 diguanylate cyclase [Acinetobacter sp. MD2]